jgi:peptide/nickel transport system substrate-binding protein
MPVIQFKVRKPPFDNPKVMEAIDLSLDRDDFINTLLNGDGNYNGPIPWTMQKWALPQDELRTFYRPDSEKAKQLLTEAGYGDGFSVKLKIPNAMGTTFIADLASLIKSHLSQVDIDLQIDEVITGFIASVILPGNFDMSLSRRGPFDDPDEALQAYHSPAPYVDQLGYSNPQLDALIDAQSREFDSGKRRQIIFEAQSLILREHAPQITLPSGFEYQARWAHVHFPHDAGQQPPPGVLPYGCDIWTEKA